MSKHTQGPWTCFPKFDTPNLYAVYDKDENFFDDGSINCSTQRANARLIAAAPDLLEVLINIVNGIETNAIRIETDQDEIWLNAFEKMKNAISKAKGEA